MTYNDAHNPKYPSPINHAEEKAKNHLIINYQRDTFLSVDVPKTTPTPFIQT
jgi:hypothetical protein